MKPKILQPVHPNLGIEAELRVRLTKLIEAMHKSVLYWVTASYRANEPEMAQDATPARALRDTVDDLTKRWQSRFDVAAK